MTGTLLAGLLAGLLVGLPAERPTGPSARQPSAVPDVLTPERAVALALKRSPTLTSFRARRTLEQARADDVFSLENPSLRLRTQLDVAHPVERLFEDTTTVGLRWSPPSSRTLFGRRAVAHRAVKRRSIELDAAAARIRTKVLQTYASLIYEQDRLQAADEALALSSRQLEAVKARLEANAATQLQASLLELEHLDAAGERRDIQSAVAERRRALFDVLGLPPTSTVAFERGRSLCDQPPPSPNEAMQRALATSATLAVTDARLFELDGNRNGRWLRFTPWPKYLEAGYQVPTPSDRLKTTPNSPLGGVRLRIGFTLPLFDQDQGRTRILAARRSVLMAERAVERTRIERQARNLASDLARQITLRTQLEQATTPLLQSSSQLLQATLQAGGADLVEVNTVRRRILRAKRALLRAGYQCEKTAIALQALMDVPPGVS